MTEKRKSLAASYRGATADTSEADAALLDVDTLARLAAGEHLGEQHERVLEALSRSAPHAAALQVAMATQGAAEALAGGLASGSGRSQGHRGRARETVHAPRTERRWPEQAALAAGVALAFALFLSRGPADQPPAVAEHAAAVPGDAIVSGTFEDDSIFRADGFEPELPADRLMSDDFDS